MSSEKSLPASIEAERAVCGSILLNRDAIIAIASWLKPACFYLEKHTWVYEAALTCYEGGVPPDTITIAAELRRHNRLDALGGISYLSELIDSVPTSYHIEYYARQVERTALLRGLIIAGGTIAALGYDEQQDAEAAIGKAQAALDQLAGQRTRDDDGLVMISDVIDRRYHEIEAAQASGDQVKLGVQTGYLDLDEITGGLQKSDLIILAARPSVGKSSLATSLAYNIGGTGHRVDIFSLEMSREQNLDRLISMHTGINLQQIRQLRFNDDVLRIYMDALGYVNALPLAIDDRAALNVQDIRARILRRQAKSGTPDLVIIDYLQLMGGVRRSENRVQEVSEISRGLKQLAKELNVPILALSQLSRAVEGRTSHVPMLSDLRESGALEQDADIVMFIYREELYDKESDKKGIAEIHIAKHRNGPCAVIPMRFEAATTRFLDLSYRTPDTGHRAPYYD